jgi:hypothetical protein
VSARAAQLALAPDDRVEVDDDFEAINELLYGKGWTDGLPVVPPTVERVERMLAYSDRAPDEVIGHVPPRYGIATTLRIAANAVMAGCRPEHLPVLLAAVEALADERLNLYSLQSTTHNCAVLTIVNGPIARELDINAGGNALGQGRRANAVLGRAVRLMLLNIGGGIPGQGDMATLGQPGKYSYCLAENEAASPWEPLHVERGYPRETSTVTLVGAEGPHNVNDHESLTAGGVLAMVAGTVAITGSNNIYYAAEPLVILGPEHAATIAREGFTKADVKRFLYEHARVPLGRLSHESVERRIRRKFPKLFRDANLDALAPLAQRAEDFMVIVAGGAGKHSAYVPTFGGTRSVTVPIRLRDGSHAGSVEAFRTP